MGADLVDPIATGDQTEGVTRQEIDDYLSAVDEPKRSTLESLRATILSVVPEAEECVSYGVPGFRVGDAVVAGFAAHRAHLGYYPHSEAVLTQLGDEVAGYSCSKGTLRFPIDTPLPRELVEVRLAELAGG
jgi:uncharacterized protein YdhG (YjbR/CyaY superfamily)